MEGSESICDGAVVAVGSMPEEDATEVVACLLAREVQAGLVVLRSISRVGLSYYFYKMLILCCFLSLCYNRFKKLF